MPLVTIKLRAPAAAELRQLLQRSGDFISAPLEVCERLRKVLLPALDAAAKPGKRRALAASRRKADPAETGDIRRACLERARGLCECGCGRRLGARAHMDHFFGRAKVRQIVANCWVLTPECDRAKTDNKPSAAHWLRAFVAHAQRHASGPEAPGYAAAIQRAQARLDALVLQGRAQP